MTEPCPAGQGCTAEELGTYARLRKAQVKDGTAYLDFSEAFRFNSLGKEGLSAQLQQVVDRFVNSTVAAPVKLDLVGEVPQDAAVREAWRRTIVERALAAVEAEFVLTAAVLGRWRAETLARALVLSTGGGRPG